MVMALASRSFKRSNLGDEAAEHLVGAVGLAVGEKNNVDVG